jgi:hypothetical protein
VGESSGWSKDEIDANFIWKKERDRCHPSIHSMVDLNLLSF